MSYHQDLEQFSQEITPQLTTVQKQFMTKIAAYEKECINKAGDNESKYVDCIFKFGEKSEKEMRNLELKLTFWRHDTFECFQNHKGTDYRKCKEQAQQKLDSYLQSSLRAI